MSDDPDWPLLHAQAQRGDQMAWTRLWELCHERFIRAFIIHYERYIPSWADTTADMAATKGFREGIAAWSSTMSTPLPHLIAWRVKKRLLDVLEECKSRRLFDLYGQAISLDGEPDQQSRHEWLIGQEENGFNDLDGPIEPDTFITKLASLANLQPQELALLRAFAVEKKSYLELAEDFGKPMGTIQSRLSRTRAKLRTEPKVQELLATL